MVNGYKKIYRVKVISNYNYGTFERDFESLKKANEFALSLMMFDMSIAGTIQDLLTITEVEEEV